MPEWHERDQWTNMGLWDLEDRQKVLHRKVCEPMLRDMRVAQSRARTRSLGRERTFALQQTGDVTLLSHGMLIWRVLLQLLRHTTPRKILAAHGMKWPKLEDAVESWHLHVDGLAGLLPEFGRVPRSQVKRTLSVASAGGRP